MSTQFQLSVLTPGARVFDGSVGHAAISGHAGEFGVLPGHCPYITAIRPGALTIETKDGNKTWAVGHGFAQVAAERVSLVISQCEAAADIDLAAARATLNAAEKILLDAEPGESAYTDAEVDQALAIGRILAAERLIE
jgi:F-type H+-transporting ATPase subunit epsilon